MPSGCWGFLPSTLSLGGGFIDFYFHPDPKLETIQFNEHIFQMGGSTTS